MGISNSLVRGSTGRPSAVRNGVRMRNTLTAVRDRHPGLCRYATWSTLRTAADHDHISVSFALTLPAAGVTLSAFGTACIVLRSRLRGRHRLEVFAHELAHAWLGHGADTHAPGLPLRRRRAADEREAGRFAAALLRGSDVGVWARAGAGTRGN